jgi:lipoate-protein ligase B
MKRRSKTWLLVELPLTDYIEALNLQRDLVAAKARGELHDDLVLSLQHSPVFTIGRRGGREHLKVTEDFLKRSGIPVIEVERGGNITFHGPGQLVVYPIINLEAAGIRVDEYVHRLEEAMIRTAAAWGISAGRNRLNKGAWVGMNKLGSIGITIRHEVSFHGLAFNVNNSLEPFSWINPCGLEGIGVTSIERELSQEASFKITPKGSRHSEEPSSIVIPAKPVLDPNRGTGIHEDCGVKHAQLFMTPYLDAARGHLISQIEEVFDVSLVRTDMASLRSVPTQK